MTLNFGTIWGEAIALLRNDPVMVIVAMLVSTVPSVLADIFLSEGDAVRAVAVLSLVLLLFQLIIVDRSLRVSDAVSGRATGRNFFYARAFGQSLLWGLAVIGGMIFLILPGIFIALRWLIVVPVLVGKNTSVLESFAESWGMTKGHTVKLIAIFGAALSPVLATIVCETLFMAEYSVGWSSITETILSACIIMCWYLQIAVFLALRESGEIRS